MLPARVRLTTVRPLARSLSSTAPAAYSSGATSASTPLAPIPTTPTSREPVPQAPNRAERWSTSQQLRPPPGSNPRFEQTAYEFQPAPLSAMEMVNSEPIILSKSRIAACDGGGGPLGHPKVFINLDKPGPRPCGYCGLRFEKAHTHHH